MTHFLTSNNSPGRLTVLAALIAGLSAPAMAAPGSVVISQVYGGGGNNGATYKNDFIELFNRSNAPVTLGDWSVQYTSSAGDSWAVTNVGNIILQPGQYYLVQAAMGAGGTADLPTPDATGTTAMSATAGKVVLVSNRTKLTGTSPSGANVLDVVGFGTAANYYEGTGPTPAPANPTAVLRGNNGCLDTDDNKTDFAVGTPQPRNRGSALNVCSGGGGGTPQPQPIVPTCPASISAEQGSATSAFLSATDSDSIVNSIALGSGAVAGISLTGVSPATADGGTARASLSVAANTAAGTYPVVVNFGNDDAQSASCTVSVRVSGSLTIPQIQGSGAASQYNNSVQTTEGVITMKVSSGFFIQDANGDNDATTSDAIFVFGGQTAAVVGDKVRVTATVTDFTPSGATRSYTELKDASSIVKLGSGFSVTPTNIELPNDDLARYEAMLVHFTTPLTVNGNAYLGDRGELVLSYGRREVPTNRYPARSPEALALAAANARNFVLLDDGIFTAPPTIPYLAADGTVRSGDTVTGLTGVLDFGAMGGGGAWFKLQPTDAPVFTRTNPRTEAPTVAPGNVKVASANVLNFFTTFTNGADAFGKTSGQGCTIGGRVSASNCRGADNLQEFVRQRDKIVNSLKAMDADVVGLMEIQNNGDVAASYLVDALNAAIGKTTYAVVPKPAATGTDAIRVAMIYKPAVVSLVGAALSDGDSVNNRPPMAQTFKAANGAKFSLVVNHLKSKGSCSGAGAGDTESGDGQGCWNATRLEQAQRLANYFIPQVVAASGDADVLAVGDFNAHGFEDPINYLTAHGMVNEIERFVRPHGIAYSYVFDAESGYLDHALASTSLDGQVAGVTEWHNNADEPDAIDYNLGDTAQDPYVNNSYRASDHDPVIVSLNLAPTFVDVSAGVSIARSGLAVNRTTGKSTGTVSFTNTSGAVINGPLQFKLDGLAAGVTLDNASGTQGGAPYITLSNSAIAPGATVTVGVTFTNPGKVSVTYTPKLISGTF